MSRTAAVLLTLASACDPGDRRAFPASTYSLSIGPAGGGTLMLAVRDSLAVAVDSLECHGDECLATPLPAAAFAWSVSPPEIGYVAPGASLHALRPGKAVIRAERAGRVATDSVVVYPAVSEIAWRPRVTRARAGDTLRLSVVALDSSGREVARIPAHAIIGGTGAAGQLVSWGGPDPTTVWLDRPGLMTLVARLAHRWDTLRVEVR